MTLPLNPIGISTLPDIRDRAPMLAAAAGELGCTNLPSARAAKEFTQACDGCDSDEIKKSPQKLNYVAVAGVAGQGNWGVTGGLSRGERVRHSDLLNLLLLRNSKNGRKNRIT